MFSILTLILEAATVELKDMMELLVTQIFIAHHQWSSNNQLRASLDLESFMTVEDFQMHITLEYFQNPTSNKVTSALHPICLEYLSPKGKLRKGVISFPSTDT